MDVKGLAEKLAKHPDLKQRMEELLIIAENSSEGIAQIRIVFRRDK